MWWDKREREHHTEQHQTLERRGKFASTWHVECCQRWMLFERRRIWTMFPNDPGNISDTTTMVARSMEKACVWQINRFVGASIADESVRWREIKCCNKFTYICTNTFVVFKKKFVYLATWMYISSKCTIVTYSITVTPCVFSFCSRFNFFIGCCVYTTAHKYMPRCLALFFQQNPFCKRNWHVHDVVRQTKLHSTSF